MKDRSKILVAPLDWGIGHATRMIPIIKYLITLNFEVIIAADGPIKSLLELEFKQNQYILLPGYNIKYSKHKKWLPVKIISQIPKILYSIYKEHKWLKKVVKTYGIEAIISDNRFGLFHATIPCAYITHQLVIKANNKFIENRLQYFHSLFIKKFTSCWVPDYHLTPNIAGELSHPAKKLLTNVEYIGALSRFNKVPTGTITNDLLILLSGPEPQRTIFEDLLILQLQHFEGKILLVRGLPLEKNTVINNNLNKNIKIKNHLPAGELNIAIERSELVICRSGYTTIMDLIKLQKKAILVATPGQTEQAYLAKYLFQQHLFYSVDQSGFLLKKVLEGFSEFKFSRSEFDMEQFKNPINKFLKLLNEEAIN